MAASDLPAPPTAAGGTARLRASAAKRYESLLREFPEAFADHAARFFGDDPKRRAAFDKKGYTLIGDVNPRDRCSSRRPDVIPSA